MPVTRVQLKRTAGWRMPPNTEKVDRSTRWGNPYVIGAPVDLRLVRRWGWVFSPQGKLLVCTDADEAVRRFVATLGFDEAIHPFVREKLRGKNLACWCGLDGPCHADFLLELANR